MKSSSHPAIQNVIYIHTHDMGRYISPYGYGISTPNLQRLAEGATLFRQAFCAGPTCSPSRAGLLTGITPHESGMLGLAHRGFKLRRPELHLGAYLRQQGFLTALCGIQHEFNSAWEQMPYEEVRGEKHTENFLETDRAATRAAVEFLEQKHERRFFLSYGLFYPHRPFAQANGAESAGHIRPPDPLPDLLEIRQDMDDYHHTVHLADECIGQVLETIRRTGRDKDTLVIVTTDHGIAFPKMKCALSDHGIGVTLMMGYPGNPTAGQATDAMVSHLDVYPTICDLLGLDPPAHLQGCSLRPVLEDPAAKVRDEIFAEVTYHAAYEPLRCLRTERHKLIHRFGGPRRPLSNCDESPSKAVLLKRGWGEEALASAELYDLMCDPQEANNLADSPSHAEIRSGLEARLRRWMEETGDPLLKGPVPPPEGAVVNTPESIDPAAGPFETIAGSVSSKH